MPQPSRQPLKSTVTVWGINGLLSTKLGVSVSTEGSGKRRNAQTGHLCQNPEVRAQASAALFIVCLSYMFSAAFLPPGGAREGQADSRAREVCYEILVHSVRHVAIKHVRTT